jgi:hypothetical protein
MIEEDLRMKQFLEKNKNENRYQRIEELRVVDLKNIVRLTI